MTEIALDDQHVDKLVDGRRLELLGVEAEVVDRHRLASREACQQGVVELLLEYWDTFVAATAGIVSTNALFPSPFSIPTSPLTFRRCFAQIPTFLLT